MRSSKSGMRSIQSRYAMYLLSASCFVLKLIPIHFALRLPQSELLITNY